MDSKDTDKTELRWWQWAIFAFGWLFFITLGALVGLGTPSGFERAPGRPDAGYTDSR